MSDLSKTIFSKNGLKLLKLFLYSPREEIHQAEATKRSGLSRMTVTRLLKEFLKGGILRESRKGDLVLYSIVSWNPVVRQLKILLNVENLYEGFRSLAGGDTEVFLYGSAARGEDEEKSDLDILIISGNSDVQKALENARQVISREINAVIFSPAEYAKLRETNKLFYDSVEKDKIAVITW